MARNGAPRIAVLGAGPIGLEAALYARALKWPAAVYERGRVGEHLLRWGHVKLFSPFGMNSTPLGRTAVKTENPRHTLPGEGDCITGREHVSAYLEPLSKTESLRDCLQLNTQVVAISRRGLLKEDTPGDARRAQQPFLILIRDDKKNERFEEADAVLDCTGTYGQHRWLGDGGIPARGETAASANISYGLEDILGDRKQTYAGKTVLVVGAGYSAATTVSNLATLGEQQSDTWVVWLARCASTQPIKRLVNDPLRERDRLATRANMIATRTDANVEFHHQTFVEAVEFAGPDKGFKVTARQAGKQRTWDAERLIANVGYTPDTDLYRELQVHECWATLGPMGLSAALLKHASGDCLTLTTLAGSILKNPEPNFFILGSKSFGRNPNCLLRAGFDQVRDVFALLAAKPGLNLYAAR